MQNFVLQVIQHPQKGQLPGYLDPPILQISAGGAHCHTCRRGSASIAVPLSEAKELALQILEAEKKAR